MRSILFALLALTAAVMPARRAGETLKLRSIAMAVA